jgi:hypothetical protein
MVSLQQLMQVEPSLDTLWLVEQVLKIVLILKLPQEVALIQLRKQNATETQESPGEL